MSVKVATCKGCETDILLADVIAVKDNPDAHARRLTWVCSDCGVRDTFIYSWKDYKRMLKGRDASVLVGKPVYDSDEIGRLVQGFRVDLDELDRDFNIIVEGWAYEDRRLPWVVPQETEIRVGLEYCSRGES